MCLKEARPSVLGIFLLRFLAGSALAIRTGGDGHPVETALGALVWVSAIWSVYLFNGVMDVREDKINGSRRPIARGDLDPDVALVYVLCGAAVSLTGALLLRGPTIWLVAAVLALGYLYSGPPYYLKRGSTGTAVVGGLAGLMSYLAGFTAATGGEWSERGSAALPLFAAGASLWMGLIGTATKDLPDVAGDAASGRRTLAVRHGDFAVRVGASVTALTLACTFIGLTVAAHLALMAPGLAMLAGAIAVAALSLTPLSKGDRSHRRRPYRAFMVTQYALHITALLPLVTHLVLSL
ncbi:UbiA family prenyltransferase [Microbispora sp. NPDC049125]|uniref:UbiA family prenyltransferase n=1 Tax=Microbispora sp. NPDC049125 TaxID=3154929 RepID=UPI0034659A70